jgi:SAM-dependent methyltransferase
MIGVAGTADEVEFFRSGETTAAAIKEMLQVEPPHTVLEIGCGVGRIGRFLSSACRTWIGTDISSQMLRFAHNNLAGLQNVELIELSSSSLREVASASLDRVYCTAVFMHLDEWDRYKYVTEAFRVLVPGGRCYFDNINLAGDVGWNIFLEMTKYEPELRPPNISKSSTAEELATYLERAGFENVQRFPGAHFVAVTGTKPELSAA